MERLILVTNQIRDALASVQLEFGVDLPRIAVVGGQSVGKSSLLEGIVGRAFLPTSPGICTRRPLLLRLTHAPGGSVPPGSTAAAAAAQGGSAEWGEFGHLPGRRFESFEQVREEIVRETERACGSQQIVLPEPIVLAIFSPNVIDLTLIDLPGMTRVPVGDQPPDIERRIRELVLEHISSPRCLILAVVAGNADLATADALAAAREVDPDGERTIGVVTKLDLVDHASDALSVLEGRVYPLRLGFIGVVQRSHRDVQKGKEMRAHLADENEFFRSHPAYRSVAHKCGIDYLARRLNKVLMEHISAAMPDVKAQAARLIHEHEVELQSYGEVVCGHSLSDQGALLLNLISKFAGRFGDAVDGKLACQSTELLGPQCQLVGRARIDFIFRDVFSRTVQDFNCFSGLSDGEVRVAVRNATGPRASLFVPEAAFELLARRQIAKLLAPSLQCAELVFEELQRVLMLSELPEFRRFISLREQIFTVVRDILRRRLEPAGQMIRDLIDVELAYINTNHPDFIGASGALRAASQQRAAAAPPSESPASERSGQSAVQQRAAAQEPSQQAVPSADPGAPNAPPGIFRRAFSFLGGGGEAGGSAPSASPRDSPERSARASATQGVGPAAGGVREMSALPASGIVGGAGAGGPRLRQMPVTVMPAQTPATQREQVEVAIIKMLLESYLTIVKKNIADSIPKAVTHFMVNALKDAIQSDCVARLYKEELFGLLLREASDVQSQRVKCHDRLKALNRVVEVVEQIRDCADTL